jgi:tetratricopeptide (TPR) repeat protein
VTEHQDALLVAVRAGVRAELYGQAAAVALAAWQVADEVAKPAWWHELARHGEEAAIKARDPSMLIDLLNRSAEVYDVAGDRPAAEQQWVRVAKLAYELGDHERIVANLTTLIGLYGRWDRRGPAMDALLELADAQREAGDSIGRAWALAELGYLMLAARRPSNADTYLETADDILTHAASGSVEPTMHARVLEQRGRALWQLDHSIRARRCFTRALEVLGDHDPAASERIRGLLETNADEPTLPEE